MKWVHSYYMIIYPYLLLRYQTRSNRLKVVIVRLAMCDSLLGRWFYPIQDWAVNVLIELSPNDLCNCVKNTFQINIYWYDWSIIDSQIDYKCIFGWFSINNECLKLPSLFTAWLFWTFHNKSHNMKALVILSHSWSQFLPLTC